VKETVVSDRKRSFFYVKHRWGASPWVSCE